MKRMFYGLIQAYNKDKKNEQKTTKVFSGVYKTLLTKQQMHTTLIKYSQTQNRKVKETLRKSTGFQELKICQFKQLENTYQRRNKDQLL